MKQTDLLTKFNRKKKSWMSPKHPLFLETMEQKIAYCEGVFSHATLNKDSNTLNNYELGRLMVKGLGLDPKQIAKIIRVATEEVRVADHVLWNVADRLKQYLFIMDLINVSLRKDALSKEEKDSIEYYRNLFCIPNEILQLLWAFVQAAYDNNMDQCIRLFATMRKENLPLTMTELKYYMPDMEYVTEIENKSVLPGKETRIVDACTIKDRLIVPKEGTLVLDHAVIYLYGSIIVDGGTLIIRDTTIINKADSGNCLIEVKSYSDVSIENSIIDCRYVGSAINQKNGNLRMKDSKIYHTTKNSAIKFWGNQIEIDTSSFHKCYTNENGAAIQIQQGNGNVSNCIFTECEAQNGGAIYVGAQIIIACCSFKHCYALDHGGAIFYNNEVKSNVMDCQYIECYPKEEEIIQYLHGHEEKVIDKEYRIHIATILDIPLRVTELGILNLDHVVIYQRQPILCKGILEIKRSKVIADGLRQRDMFEVSRCRGVVIERSEFDGRGTSSVFRATGSRMIVVHSLFQNIKNGRAIYDAMEPKISDTIFSYCQDGAIYSCAGTIQNCLFINCRQKSGAGVIMYGSRGEISNCRFVRCVSEYSGGAIDKSGGHQIIHCEFKECKPDNIA
ncbi:right-handed parallel beta-helix repeat-containing protein [Anaerosporobacter faecicola]|uniref:right-handed parallel beta-helix repeat-containing protein n=1 Tax=Anaerosporobacter faecicola TaxID=2718714 RepID=UPI001438E6E5|nr:right-handed parallel beta-helix repeat-containing protein [Anaerosporobacter faecicola]